MSTESRAIRDVTTRLGYLLKHAERRLNELNTQALAPLQIDARELGILQTLSGEEPVSQIDVARRLGVDRTTIVGMLDTLEAKALVTRQLDPADRRRNTVQLTPVGCATLQAGLAASDEAERTFLASLSERDAQGLRDALRVIISESELGEE